MSGSIFDLVMHSGLVAKVVLLVLFVFSVVSWAVMGQKIVDLRRARRASAAFLRAFEAGVSGPDLYRLGRGHDMSPLCALFCAVYAQAKGKRGPWSGGSETFWKMMGAHIAGTCAMLERHLGLLASVGSVSPFIGLFGTVWGIMDAFRNIGIQGSANLAVVAPGIAEALIATAAGLAAAIPAVMAYNSFVRQIATLAQEAEVFAPQLAQWMMVDGAP